VNFRKLARRSPSIRCQGTRSKRCIQSSPNWSSSSNPIPFIRRLLKITKQSSPNMALSSLFDSKDGQAAEDGLY
jgi:hypothetical protein